MRVSLLLVALCVGGCSGQSADQSAGLSRIPVRIVHDKLVLACDVSTRARRLPVNLFVEFDSKCGLQLHNQAAVALKAESASGETIPITIHLGDLAVTVPKREHGDQDAMELFTRYHSKELGENAIVGTIGSEVLADYFVVLDLGKGFMYLGAPRAPDVEARAEAPAGSYSGGGQQTVVPVTEVNDLVWLPVRHADGSPGALALGTSRYDTVVDAALCDELGAPDGKLESLEVGGLDLAERVAFRPAEVIQIHPDGVVGIAGLGLLADFRIEIDRVNRVARLEPRRPAKYPDTDLAFFRAMIEEEAAPLAEFLEAHPEARLAGEAARLLLDLCIAEDADAESLALALKQVQAQALEDLRATRMLDLMSELVAAQRPDLAVVAGDLGIPAGRDDRYPETVHALHAKLGELFLERFLADANEESGDRAWRHLLSAAFGTPEDGKVNLNLGRYYEAVGRSRRAFSRYVQAVIKPETGPAAFEGLARLSAESISVDRIERMIAGKTHAFGAATRYEPTEAADNGRVALVEFFTNPNLGDAERGGAIGGALGNDGLVSHFEPEHAVFITYHLPRPELVPTACPLAEAAATIYDQQLPPYIHVINGLAKGPGGGKWRAKEQIFGACRDLVATGRRHAPVVELELTARIEGSRVSAQLRVRGESSPRKTVQVVLVEKGVLYPGKSEIVIHRNLARAALTDSLSGVPFAPVGDGPGKLEMTLDLAADLQEITAANERYLDESIAAGGGGVVKMSTAIDPRQVRLIAFVRNVATGEILQALQVEPELEVER